MSAVADGEAHRQSRDAIFNESSVASLTKAQLSLNSLDLFADRIDTPVPEVQSVVADPQCGQRRCTIMSVILICHHNLLQPVLLCFLFIFCLVLFHDLCAEAESLNSR